MALLSGAIWSVFFQLLNLSWGVDWKESLQQQKVRSITDAYTEAAATLMLQEVNDIVAKLQLPERKPLELVDLTEIYMQPPFMAEHSGLFGSMRTRSFIYSASVDSKLCYVTKYFKDGELGRQRELALLKAKYTLSKTQVNTNAAYMLAKQWLAAAGIDVHALELDCKVEIVSWNFADSFVPLYWVRWIQPVGSHRMQLPTSTLTEPVAFVELLENERSLRSLRVNRSEYIKRKSLTVKDRDQLLQATDDPKLREMWFITESYKRAALQAMLHEVNEVCRQLGLSENLPIQSSSLVDVDIETPFFCDRQERFATISTTNYVYAAIAGGKLSYINMNSRMNADTKFLNVLKTKYAMPQNHIDTNAPYVLATQLLAAVGVNVEALEQDCKAEVSPWVFDNQFVPLYKIEWLKRGRLNKKRDVAATVELVQPERVLRKLWIEKPEYIRRAPLVVPNREELLGVTGDKEPKRE